MKKTRQKPSVDELAARVDQMLHRMRLDSSFSATLTLMRRAVAKLEREAHSGVKKRIEGEVDGTGNPTGTNEMFQDALIGGGSNVAQCDFCGTTYFGTWSGGRDYEDGELEELRKLARDPKNKYVEWGDCDSVSYGMLDGRQFVYACPCNASAAYEQFVWNHRHVIADYLKKRAAEEQSRAEVIGRLATDVAAATTV
jgi:hypothetical protein